MKSFTQDKADGRRSVRGWNRAVARWVCGGLAGHRNLLDLIEVYVPGAMVMTHSDTGHARHHLRTQSF